MGAEQQSLEQQMDAAELHLEAQKLASKERMDTEELKLQEQKLLLDAQIAEAKLDAEQELEGVKIGKDLIEKRENNSE